MASDDPTITVTGEATVPISADVAWLRLVIVAEARTAAEAADTSAARINIVLDSIRETEPLLPETVTEIERTLDPRFDEDGMLLGYRLRRVMSAQMPPEATGVLLDVAMIAGSAPGSNIVWGVRDPAAARARVTEAALAVAQANGHAAARVLGVELQGTRSAEIECTVPPESHGLIVATARARVTYGQRRG
ncbi:MAG: SIMPL domain-containing protein [Deltaproteobacteria bacterium]|nr:SIMPL domain-containing protein [Nannocystaceae bacterium]